MVQNWIWSFIVTFGAQRHSLSSIRVLIDLILEIIHSRMDTSVQNFIDSYCRERKREILSTPKACWDLIWLAELRLPTRTFVPVSWDHVTSDQTLQLLLPSAVQCWQSGQCTLDVYQLTTRASALVIGKIFTLSIRRVDKISRRWWERRPCSHPFCFIFDWVFHALEW